MSPLQTGAGCSRRSGSWGQGAGVMGACVIEWIERLLDVPCKLLIAPGCGLMTVSRGSASAKMALLSAAARVVRAEL